MLLIIPTKTFKIKIFKPKQTIREASSKVAISASAISLGLDLVVLASKIARFTSCDLSNVKVV